MDRIKISREFKNNMLGNLWLGLERDVPDGCDLAGQYVLADMQITEVGKQLNGEVVTYGVSTPESYDGKRLDGYVADESALTFPSRSVIKKRKEEVVASLMLAIELAGSKTATEFFRKRVQDINDEKLTSAFEEKIKQFV